MCCLKFFIFLSLLTQLKSTDYYGKHLFDSIIEENTLVLTMSDVKDNRGKIQNDLARELFGEVRIFILAYFSFRMLLKTSEIKNKEIDI